MELMSTLMVLYRRSFIPMLYDAEYGPLKYLDTKILEVLCKRGYVKEVPGKNIEITASGIERILKLSFITLARLVIYDPRTLNIEPTEEEKKFILRPKMIRMGTARLVKYLTSDEWWVRELAKEVIDMKGAK